MKRKLIVAFTIAFVGALALSKHNRHLSHGVAYKDKTNETMVRPFSKTMQNKAEIKDKEVKLLETFVVLAVFITKKWQSQETSWIGFCSLCLQRRRKAAWLI